MKSMHFRHSIFIPILLVASIHVLAAKSRDQDLRLMDCFSIAAGKAATVDGSVLLAHNEDDSGKRVVNFYKVPRISRTEETQLRLRNGASITPVERTCSFLWLEMPGLEFSDSMMNEHGVTIASNSCPSREDDPVLLNGGIGYFLRRLMVERAKTAREAVMIGGGLVDALGYSQSGRTYLIADPNEAWLMAVVQGKHWVARRVPDDHVAVIPNYYTIDSVDLSDTKNYLGSSDIKEYAQKRGWYDPEKDGKFSFRKVYSNQESLHHMGNISRHVRGVDLLSERQYGVDDEFPFSFAPKEKVSIEKLMSILRDHHEGTAHELCNGKRLDDPHRNPFSPICAASTQYGFVAQLRSDMPVEIGAVMWIAPKWPCIQYFVPWYLGITKVARGFANSDYAYALKHHFDQNVGRPPLVNLAFPAFSHYADRMAGCYRQKQDAFTKARDDLEESLIEKQADLEKHILDTFEKDPVAARVMLTEYTGALATAQWNRAAAGDQD